MANASKSSTFIVSKNGQKTHHPEPKKAAGDVQDVNLLEKPLLENTDVFAEKLLIHHSINEKFHIHVEKFAENLSNTIATTIIVLVKEFVPTNVLNYVIQDLVRLV